MMKKWKENNEWDDRLGRGESVQEIELAEMKVLKKLILVEKHLHERDGTENPTEDDVKWNEGRREETCSEHPHTPALFLTSIFDFRCV